MLISTKKSNPYGITLAINFASSPFAFTEDNAIASDCGDSIFPAATPNEFKETIQYGSICNVLAALLCTAPNSTPEFVPEPVTNVPSPPIHGANNG